MPKVLLIDDDPQIRKILERVLSHNHYEVVVAEDGVTGLREARNQRPDLIILDIIMPGMDGFEVAQRLHSDPICSRIPILVLTAYATPYGRKTAVEIGVDDFVTQLHHGRGRLYSDAEMKSLLEPLGFNIEGQYGLLVFSEFIDCSLFEEGECFKGMLELEERAGQEPHLKGIGKFVQLICTKA